MLLTQKILRLALGAIAVSSTSALVSFLTRNPEVKKARPVRNEVAKDFDFTGSWASSCCSEENGAWF